MIKSLLLWLPFLFCYYWACISFNFSLVSGYSVHCLEDQKLWLLQLKKNLKFNPIDSRKLVFWNESSPCNEWRGVSWDEEGYVAGLDLSEESISGGFNNSSTLFNLQHLRHLNLAFNNFSSAIPSSIRDLKNLTSLNLSNAGFVDQIPMEIAQLTRLTILDLSTYYLAESALKLENPNLEKFVQTLSEVKELYLDGINIALNGNEWGRALSSFLPHLQVLSMSSCNLSGPIHSSLKKLQNISVIRLDQNNLSAVVPDFFAKFSNLTNLDLYSCNLRGRFANKIFQLQTLTSLDLSYNRGLQGSLPYFPQNRPLKILILSMTNFSGALPDSISNLRQLSILEIYTCQFNGTLPNSMSNFTELTYLDLSFNNFTGTIPSFVMAKKLTYIDLSHNFLNGSIPVSLCSLPLPQSIQLFDNHLSQGQLDASSNVPSSTIQVLDLSGNYLRGPIPECIFDLKGLKVLQLSSNKFNGTLRLDKFERLRNLTTLGLSNNNLSIDANIRNKNRLSFPDMTSLMLASCNLRQFPGFLRNMSKLTYLDLSNNKIAEEIPKWIWELGYLGHLNLSHNSLMEIERTPQTLISNNLSVLDLHCNRLQGTLPVFPPLAFYLDFSYNKFSYVIPSNIGNYLSNTIFLSLSHNTIYGRIPASICHNASSLQVLDLSYNNFSGGIPDCLVISESIGVLNLRKNNLSGNIPDTFQASCPLKTLDLSSNNLQGPIPKSLSHCTTLEVLDIGNNKINDEFPCLLKTIPTLQVMVLRRNNFHGRIGCPNMKRMIWNMLQIVDLAFNNFSGILPGQCFTTWKAMMLDKNQTTSKANQLDFNFGFRQLMYHDGVIVTMKGREMILTKILTVFTSIDFSSNRIEGLIPQEMMEFTALIGLNLSNNNLTGRIPSSMRKLQSIESLDLSNNSFTGEIPSQLASLYFLSYLNLSHNHLVGKIPTGTQLQTLDASSFGSNQGLCGPPLKENCSKDARTSIKPSTCVVYADSRVEFDWKFVFTGVGFGVGSGLIVALLMFWDKGRSWSNSNIDKILLLILAKIDLVFTPTRVHETEDDTEEHKSGMADEEDYRKFLKYCVFCSNPDMSMKKAIHDPRCTCHHLPSTCSSGSDTEFS